MFMFDSWAGLCLCEALGLIPGLACACMKPWFVFVRICSLIQRVAFVCEKLS